MLAAIKVALPVLWVALAISAPASAQSANDPNRPPYAQNAARPAPQQSASGSAAASSAAGSSAGVAGSGVSAGAALGANAATRKPQDGGPSAEERALFDHANESRVLAGLPALHWDGQLAAAARRHCMVMVQHDALSHQFPGEEDMQQRISDSGAGFSALAENVALAATADEIHFAWMNSAGHRANILDPKLTAVGISVQPGNRGLYAVQDFSLQVGNISMGQQEERVRELLSAAGVRPADNGGHTATSDARRACLQGDRYLGKAAMVARFETSDLSKLPDKLQSAAASGKYRSAAVGACDAMASGGFTRFRLAVLLY
jgi:uncharacterized protein YkwD